MKGYLTTLIDVDNLLTDEYSVHKLVRSLYPKPQKSTWVKIGDEIRIRSTELFSGATHNDDAMFDSTIEFETPSVGDTFPFIIKFVPYVKRRMKENNGKSKRDYIKPVNGNTEPAKQHILAKLNLPDYGMEVLDAAILRYDFRMFKYPSAAYPVSTPVYTMIGEGRVLDQEKFDAFFFSGCGDHKYHGCGILDIR